VWSTETDDGHDTSSLFGTVCNLNRHKVYRVSGSHRDVTKARVSEYVDRVERSVKRLDDNRS